MRFYLLLNRSCHLPCPNRWKLQSCALNLHLEVAVAGSSVDHQVDASNLHLRPEDYQVSSVDPFWVMVYAWGLDDSERRVVCISKLFFIPTVAGVILNICALLRRILVAILIVMGVHLRGSCLHYDTLWTKEMPELQSSCDGASSNFLGNIKLETVLRYSFR